MSIDWGDAPTWVTAVPTALAFLVAAFSYKSSVKDRRSAQARRVYATSTVLGSYGAGDQVPSSNVEGGPGSHFGSLLSYLTLGSDHRGNQIYLAQVNIIVVTVTLHNGSDEPINAWLVQFERPTGGSFPAVGAPLGATNPGEKATFTTAVPTDLPANSVPILIPAIYFKDSADRWWMRRVNESVRRVKKNVPRA
ncbi:hypothetical protein G9U51_13605 [Calidifontibacter sp. DB0510]|uniref:Uncharacterized protein n=1 Tax=Metallococcus carri TaxID=1656884 RepID=A0A967B3R0_9MICO|nr:hypothetical protein [Metallococcus carri]NHN56810.1 hypothetical protein [Metallococcus carri]NOP37813.1 hypothetical protein [Calidifontibacter sp. DB2511S]